jgi:rod shape-determining protein MreD
VRRVLLPVVLLLVALVLQLTVLDRLPLPGGVAPDLVLLVVVALALSSGPMSGMICGFCAGLALDIAPPSDHLIGVYALVFCVVGYFCGLVSTELDRTVLQPLVASALGAAAGAGLYAVVGYMLGNPDVTGPAVRHVLPLSVLYDVLLSPFVLFGVALASRLAARLAGAAPAGQTASGPATGLGPTALPGGRTPRIRAAAARPRDGWIGGGGWLAASADLARSRPVKLHLGGTRTAAVPARSKAASAGNGVARVRFGGTRTAAAPSRSSAGSGGQRLRFGPRRGDAVVGSRLLGGGFFSEFGNGGGMLGSSSTPRLFTRRSRASGTGGWARFGRRPAWAYRGAGGAGSAPRRGSFNVPAPRKSPAVASPRRGTFSASAAPRRTVTASAPRRGAFGGGSPAKGAFGGGSSRSGSVRSPRRFPALRRKTFGAGSPARGRSALARPRGGRWPAWRIGRRHDGGYR